MTRKKKTARRKKDPREKINALGLIEALEQHILGEKEMAPTQVSAALALLKKILPDMADPGRRAEAAESGAHETALKDLE